MALPSRLSGLYLARRANPKVTQTNGNLIKVPVPNKTKLRSYELMDHMGRRVYPE